MKAVIVVNPAAELHVKWGGAFADGLRAHGWDTEFVGRRDCPHEGDLVALWGVRNRDMIARARGIGATIVVMECGYLGDRLEQISLSVGGELNGRGRFGKARDNGERFARQFGHMVRPWHGGSVGLVCGQVPGDMSLVGCSDLPKFYREAMASVADAGFEPLFRAHPKAGGKGGPIADDLAKAGVMVCWNSNSAVDAILAGTPVICADEGCMAWELAGHWPDMDIRTPDRAEWFREMAWRQWSVDEIASGLAWDVLKDAA